MQINIIWGNKLIRERACIMALCSSYSSLIRPRYTSDPFPLTQTHPAMHARSSTEAPEAFQDLFDLMQPRARLEDLLCAYFVPMRLDLTAYSVTFAPRRVGVVGPSRRTIVDVERTKDEKLEVVAKRPARKLKEYLAAKR
ncbi:hypothetical protein F5888DRAFT_1909192 [Russula emetica]|nr:hypothetical protein F5888DRAFT_1909192 [Russula emetica]